MQLQIGECLSLVRQMVPCLHKADASDELKSLDRSIASIDQKLDARISKLNTRRF